MTVDPIFTTLIQNQLDHISQQMGWVMQRTARSPIFSESHDFSCFVADAEGRLLSVADGIPIHTGGGGLAIAAVLRAFAGDIAPGDVFILNDPYEAGGNHLPDWTIIHPVFADEGLVAFTANRAHQSDVGGGAAGTYNAAATEIFHEGIRLPVLKLVERGRRRHDLWHLLMLNSRCPHLIDGDVQAMIGSTRIGARRIRAIFEEHGAQRIAETFDAILAHAERRMHAAIEAIPDGDYAGEDASDTDCFRMVEVPVKVRVRVRGGEMEVDFTGSAPQIAGFKNSSLANTQSAVFLALLSMFDYTIPRNEGCFRPIRIVAPEGTVVNALPPAPMTANTVNPASEIVHAIWKALAAALPDLACAGWGKSSHCITSGRAADGETYVMYHMHAYPAAGAVKGRDGFGTLGQIITLGGMQIPNVEVYERKYPVTIHRQEFRLDAAGPGEFRGGSGVDYEVSVHGSAEYSFRGEGIHTPSGFGTCGGRTGRKAEFEVVLADGSNYDAPQYGVRTLPAALVRIASAAGGGWGDPLRRAPGLVLRDVEDGIVSVGQAEDAYGVVLTADGCCVDRPATADRRLQLSSRRPAAAGGPVGRGMAG